MESGVATGHAEFKAYEVRVPDAQSSTRHCVPMWAPSLHPSALCALPACLNLICMLPFCSDLQQNATSAGAHCS